MKQFKDIFVHRASTNFLRIVMAVMAAVAGLLLVLVIPAIYKDWNLEFPNVGYARIPVITLLVTSAVIFYAVLHQAVKLLGYIDKNKAFSRLTVKTLEKIKYLAVLMSGVHVLLLPFTYAVAQEDDAPGLIVIGMLFALAPFAIAVFTALMQRLLQNVIDIKSENDLTV